MLAWLFNFLKNNAPAQTPIFDHTGTHLCRDEDWVWLKGQDSNSTAEARYRCRICNKEQFRGGWGSELTEEQKLNKTLRK